MLSPNHAPKAGTSQGNSDKIHLQVDQALLIPGRTLSGSVSLKEVSHLESLLVRLRGLTIVTILGKRRYQSAQLVAGAGAAAPISFIETHDFLLRELKLWSIEQSAKEEPRDLTFHFDVPLMGDAPAEKTGLQTLPLPPALDFSVGSGPGVQCRYVLEVIAKRNGLLHRDQKLSRELAFEDPPHKLPASVTSLTKSARTDLKYKSSANSAPLQLESSLTVPSHLELHAGREIHCQISWHLVAADAGPPPSMSLDLNLQLFLARKYLTRPLSTRQGTQMDFPLAILCKGTTQPIMGDLSNPDLTIIEGSITIPDGQVTAFSQGMEVQYAVQVRIFSPTRLITEQMITVPITLLSVAQSAEDPPK